MSACTYESALELRPLEDLDRVAGLELDDGLLPTGARALDHPAPLRLGRHLDDVHAEDRDLEELLDGLADLRLVRVLVHLERVAVLLDLVVALLADHRLDQDLSGVQAHDALPCTRGSAASVRTSERAQTTCATSSSDGTVTSTRGRFRNDLISVTSSSVATITVGVSWPQPSSRSTACFVDGASNESPATRPMVPAWAWSLSAARKAARAAFLFTLSEKSREVGGKATPPPANCGARIVPWRARPVPFWRHGFERPPATRPRLFAARVPWRRAFSSARTASCTTCGLISAAKTASSSETSFFAPPRTGAFGAAITSRPPGSRR